MEFKNMEKEAFLYGGGSFFSDDPFLFDKNSVTLSDLFL
jgi:hypothetical protein